MGTIDGVPVRCTCGRLLRVITPLREVPMKYGLGKGTVIACYKVSPCKHCSKRGGAGP